MRRLLDRFEVEIRKKNGNLESGLVLADAFEEHGDKRTGASLRELIRHGSLHDRLSDLSREGGNFYREPLIHDVRRKLAGIEDALRYLKEPKRRLARTRNIYRYHRRHGVRAKEAFSFAKRHGHLKQVGHLGDIHWPEYDGGPVYRDEDGIYWLDWIERAGPLYSVWRVRLDREPIPNWINPEAVSSRPTTIRRDWYSRNPIKRALARWAVAESYGWNALDQDELRLTREEVRQQYRR